MAGFNCELCGGKIIMQANKMGICNECGIEYDIEALHNMAGNKYENSTAKPERAISVPIQNSNELERNALLIYLNDLRVMETIIYESNKKRSEINNTIKQAKEHYNWFVSRAPKKPVIENYQYEKEDYNHKESVIRLCGWIELGAAIFLIVLGLFTPMEGEFSTIFLALLMSALMLGIPYFLKEKRQKENDMDVRRRNLENSRKLEKYNEEQSNYQVCISKKNSELQNASKKANNDLSKVKNDIELISDMLKEAYSANIIPMQFRNIQGCYYLYDYLSTSNQSLSEALMQCNLETIKHKIDNMIMLQSKTIVQQAQTNAKLDSIIEQNYDIIEAAQLISKNTATTAENARMAAKYAQISATNSEITRKLAEEQLTYQKEQLTNQKIQLYYANAEFWQY